MSKLYYVDDENLFLKHVERSLNEYVEPISYCGTGASNAFFADLFEGKIIYENNYFLFDARMSVPSGLENYYPVWDGYNGNKSDVCGLALARYLNINKGVALDKIKILTGYKGIIFSHFEEFSLHESSVIEKKSISKLLFQEWLCE
jgi:hypothetical protein